MFLRTLINFHQCDLGRFRLIYLSALFDTLVWQVAELPEVTDSIHVITSQMYGALESVLVHSGDVASPGSARATAVATHMAAIGTISMLSLADAIHDPMAHSSDTLIDAMVALATGRLLKQTA